MPELVVEGEQEEVCLVNGRGTKGRKRHRGRVRPVIDLITEIEKEDDDLISPAELVDQLLAVSERLGKAMACLTDTAAAIEGGTIGALRGEGSEELRAYLGDLVAHRMVNLAIGNLTSALGSLEIGTKSVMTLSKVLAEREPPASRCKRGKVVDLRP